MIVAVGLLAGCTSVAEPVAVPMAAKVSDRTVEQDTETCRAVAASGGYGADAGSQILASAANAVIRSLAYGRVSRYTVTGLGHTGVTAARMADHRKSQAFRNCMRQAGWRVY